MNFVSYPVAEKIVFYHNVIENMTGNDDFSAPDISLVDAKTAVDKLEQSILMAHDGGHIAVAKMHDDEVAADKIFHMLAAYVDRMANGDETKILGSGFHESRQPVYSHKAQLTVNDGANSGCVILIAKAVDKAGSYIWQSAKDVQPETDSGWILAGITTRSHFDISGLVVSAKYYFRVAAITPNGTSDFCPPVSRTVI